MDLQDLRTHTYVRLDDDSLKNFNEQTKRLWDYGIEYAEIIETKEGSFLCEYDLYLKLAQTSVPSKDVYGVENVNFSLINPGDQRWQEFVEQRLTRGFDDSETWSLFTTISKFILPRLKRFREICTGCPVMLTEEKWYKILGEMIKGFELFTSDKFLDSAEEKIAKRALWLFYKHFEDLWW